MPLGLNLGLGLTTQRGGGAAAQVLDNLGSLFLTDEDGAWLDFDDISTLSQDDAGTTPVTGDGQAVGRITDKSGNSNHFTQSTASRRPLFNEDGSGVRSISNDLVDDIITRDEFITAGSSRGGFFVCAAVHPNQDDANRRFFFEMGAGSVEGLGVALTDQFVKVYTATNSGGASETDNTVANTAGSSRLVLSFVVDFDDTQYVRLNGSQIYTENISLSQLTSNEMSLDPGDSYHCAVLAQAKEFNRGGRMFGGFLHELLVLGRLPTAGEVSTAENHLMTKWAISP